MSEAAKKEPMSPRAVRHSFTLTDNETGDTYELPILHANIGPRVIDIGVKHNILIPWTVKHRDQCLCSFWHRLIPFPVAHVLPILSPLETTPFSADPAPRGAIG